MEALFLVLGESLLFISSGCKLPLLSITNYKAGQAAAKATGKIWGGSKKGRLLEVTDEQAKAIIKMKADGEKISRIARTVSLSKLTIYRVLERYEQGLIELDIAI